MFFRASRILGVLALSGLAGCALHLDVPPDFLQLDTRGHEIKATTADDAILWVREFEDPDEGEVRFWAEALENDLVGRRGYRLVGKQDVADGEGSPGRLLEFTTDFEGRERGYLVALFVPEPGTVRVLELVAEKAVFDRHAPLVRKAVATLERRWPL